MPLHLQTASRAVKLGKGEAVRRELVTVAAITLSMSASAATRENGSETVSKAGDWSVTCDGNSCTESGGLKANQALEITNAENTAVPPEVIDRNLQRSSLWRLIKSEFPGWYQEHTGEISQLSTTASESQLSKHVLGKLAELQRANAKHARSSSREHLIGIARTFLANLSRLAGYSTEACYSFIAGRETSAAAIFLFPKPRYGDGIERHLTAVFRAVANGRKAPVSREKATKQDYNLLAAQLIKIGWSQDDLELFADPQTLSKAPSEKTCKMVQEWLSAHITMKNKAAQERLLAETLTRVFVVGPQPGFFKFRKRGTLRKWAWIQPWEGAASRPIVDIWPAMRSGSAKHPY